MHWSGSVPGYNALVLDLLGPNLDDLLLFCQGTFTPRTVALLGLQMLDLLEHLHSKDFVHRDIKPENFLIGIDQGGAQTVYLIDFGLSKRYRDKSRGIHMPFSSNHGLTGTMRYVSINMHMGMEPSRRDDLESLLYVLVYFMKGGLPWQGLVASNREEKIDAIMECKMSISVDELCYGLPRIFFVLPLGPIKNLVGEYVSMLYYVRSLEFEDKPNYDYLRELLYDVLDSYRAVPGSLSDSETTYDWMELVKSKSPQQQHESESDPQKVEPAALIEGSETESNIPNERVGMEEKVPCFEDFLQKPGFRQKPRTVSGSSGGTIATQRVSPFAVREGIIKRIKHFRKQAKGGASYSVAKMN